MKVGCVGKGTKSVLAQHTDSIDYAGNAVDTQVIGSEFSTLVGDDSCLFPVSNISKRTIQKHMQNQEAVFDFVVYETQIKESSRVDLDTDVVIVTSPSNATAYIKMQGSANKTFIAMGKTTGKQLFDLGVEKYLTPKIPGEIGLIDCIQEIQRSN